jgi:hypothetical protein
MWNGAEKTSACLVLHVWHTIALRLKEERNTRLKSLRHSIQRAHLGMFVDEWASIKYHLKMSRRASEQREKKHDHQWMVTVWKGWQKMHVQHHTILLKARSFVGKLTEKDRCIISFRDWADIVRSDKQQRLVVSKYRRISNKGTCRKVVRAWSTSCAWFSSQRLFSACMERHIARRSKQCVYSTWLAVALDNIKLITSARRVVERSAFSKLRRGFNSFGLNLAFSVRAENSILARAYAAQVFFLLLYPTTLVYFSSALRCPRIDSFCCT